MQRISSHDPAGTTGVARNFLPGLAIIALGLLVLVQSGSVAFLGESMPAEIRKDAKPRVLAAYGNLPLSFEANKGQTDSQVKFLSRGRAYTLFLTSTEAVLSLRKGSAEPEGEVPRLVNDRGGTGVSPVASRSRLPDPAVLRMKLLGANPEARVTGLEKLPGKSNYFIGNDPKKWRANVPHYVKVKYEEVYPGIDLVYYGTNQRQLEYDFVVASGADPRAIRLSLEGAEELTLDKEGNLQLGADAGEVTLNAPAIYQKVEGAREFLKGGYVLEENNQVTFDLAAYDTTKPLIIDPVLSYSTNLGGTDDESSVAIAVDFSGNAYVTGATFSADFITSPNAFQTVVPGGTFDAFVTKLNAAGDGLVYSTYLGGNSNEAGADIAVDDSGNAYVTGGTDSTDFPTMGTLDTTCGTDGTCNGACNGGQSDAFVTKLNPDGTNLVYSTYLGGADDETSFGIDVGSSGNAYITGG